LIKKKNGWDDLVPYAAFAYNSAIHDSTGFSPFKLLYGREALLPSDLRISPRKLRLMEESENYSEVIKSRFYEMRDLAKRNMEKAARIQIKTYNRKHNPIVFNKGDLVLLNTPMRGLGKRKAFDKNFHGPYEVLMKLNENNYEVEEINENKKKKFRGVVHLKYMKRYFTPKFFVQNEEVENSSESEKEESDSETEKPDPRKLRPRKPLKYSQ